MADTTRRTIEITRIGDKAEAEALRDLLADHFGGTTYFSFSFTAAPAGGEFSVCAEASCADEAETYAAQGMLLAVVIRSYAALAAK